MGYLLRVSYITIASNAEWKGEPETRQASQSPDRLRSLRIWGPAPRGQTPERLDPGLRIVWGTEWNPVMATFSTIVFHFFSWFRSWCRDRFRAGPTTRSVGIFTPAARPCQESPQSITPFHPFTFPARPAIAPHLPPVSPTQVDARQRSRTRA
jgi:hypothetical protein